MKKFKDEENPNFFKVNKFDLENAANILQILNLKNDLQASYDRNVFQSILNENERSLDRNKIS